MLGDSININNLCCTVQYFWKKLVKPLEICFQKLFFIKISYGLAELWIFFYFVWFFVKKGHFQLKQLKESSDKIVMKLCAKSNDKVIAINLALPVLFIDVLYMW